MPSRQLDFLGAVIVLDGQLASVVFIGLRQKQRHRQIRANADASQMIASHRIVNVNAKMLSHTVTIEQWRKNVFGDRSRDEQRVGGERLDNALAERPRNLAIG